MALSQYFGIGTAGNNGVECRVLVTITDDAANNRSAIAAEVQFRKSNGFQSQGNTGGSLTIHGSGGGVGISGNKILPSNGSWVSFGSAPGQWIGHGADGRAPYTEVRVNGIYLAGSSDFDTAVSGTLSFDSGNGFADYNRLPGAPSNLRLEAGSLSTTSFGVRYDRGSGASGTDHAEWSRADTGAVVWNDYGPAGYTSPNGGLTPGAPALVPGVQYRVRVRSNSGDGYGAWSSYFVQRTMSAAYVGKAGAFPPAAGVSAGQGGAFTSSVEVRVGNDGSFVNAG